MALSLPSKLNNISVMSKYGYGPTIVKDFQFIEFYYISKKIPIVFIKKYTDLVSDIINRFKIMDL